MCIISSCVVIIKEYLGRGSKQNKQTQSFFNHIMHQNSNYDDINDVTVWFKMSFGVFSQALQTRVIIEFSLAIAGPILLEIISICERQVTKITYMKGGPYKTDSSIHRPMDSHFYAASTFRHESSMIPKAFKFASKNCSPYRTVICDTHI
eukprot:COSAG05_NODE_726_length_7707_cov_30.238302_2_plen_150_part_00